jgi:hypothetical protein
MERELARAHALLAMQEERNRKLPGPGARRLERRGVRQGLPRRRHRYMAFLKDHDIPTVKDTGPALRARIGSCAPPPRELSEVDFMTRG